VERNFQPDSHATVPISSVWPVAPHYHTHMHVPAGRMTGSGLAAAGTLPQSGHTRRPVPFDARIRLAEWAALVSVSGIWTPAAAAAAAAACDQTCVTSHCEQGDEEDEGQVIGTGRHCIRLGSEWCQLSCCCECEQRGVGAVCAEVTGCSCPGPVSSSSVVSLSCGCEYQVRVRKQTADGTGRDWQQRHQASLTLIHQRPPPASWHWLLPNSGPGLLLHRKPKHTMTTTASSSITSASASENENENEFLAALRVMRPMPENVTQRNEKRRTTTSGPLVLLEKEHREEAAAAAAVSARYSCCCCFVVRQTDITFSSHRKVYDRCSCSRIAPGHH
jgi:hypothetical protein